MKQISMIIDNITRTLGFSCVFVYCAADTVLSLLQILEYYTEKLWTGWELVFRGLSGIGKQIYQAWTKKTSNPCTLAGGCIPNNLDLAVATLPNDTHLKSPLVDQWTSLNIEQVKLEFHDEKRVMYMVFNGSKSAYNNWFVKTRLLESSFDDLYSDGCLKYFSLTAAYAKRFAVIQEGFSCTPGYYWWIAIADYKYSSSGYRCLFEKTGSYPLLIYAPSQHKSKFNDPKHNGFRLAKAMTIHIKRQKQ